jgi:hypothetical protein
MASMRTRKPLFSCIVLGVFLLAGAQPATSSANSVLLRSLVFDHSNTACASVDQAGNLSPAATQTGVAFDGTRLLISCWSDNTITAVSPATGAELAVYHINGGTSFGAMAWDPVDNELWACNGHENDVGVIDLTTSTFMHRFTAKGCTDGLAFDPADDTLWAGRDGGHTVATVEHYTLGGTLLSSVNVGNLVNDRSGIAVAGSRVFLASPHSGYPKHLWQTTRAFSTADVLATWTGGAKAEDLECDGTTFSTPAIWVQWNHQNLLQAYAIGGTCGPPSGAELTVSQAPSASTAPADSAMSITSTVTNLGPASAANLTVTLPVPTATIVGTVTPSQGTCAGGTTITCSIGTVAAGSSVTINVPVTPLAPGAMVSTVTANSDTTISPGTDTVSVSVTPQTGTVYATISDAGFAPGTVTPPLGGTVQWNFTGAGTHSVHDATGLGLFDTGAVAPVDYRTTPLTAAGTYTVADGSSPATGAVAVPLTAPASSSLGSPIPLTWAMSIPAGLVEDVQVLRPGLTAWATLTTTTAASGAFTPDAGAGSYKFRARLRNPATRASSKYSSARTVKVA